MVKDDADLEERVFQRLDPEGELGRLLTLFRPLTNNALARGILTVLTGGRADLSTIRDMDQRAAEMTSAIAKSLTLFTPLGWAPTAYAPADVYARAVAVYEATGSTDAAEQVLLDGWNEGRQLGLRPGHLISLGRGDEELETNFGARHVLVQKAMAHHEAGGYEASVPIVLAQADGIILELTGKMLFVKGQPKHLLSEGSIAGLPQGLQVLAPLLSQSQNDTTVSGALQRHAILHGRELGYDTKINSTKSLVLLMGVMDWAEPQVKQLVVDRKADREALYAGRTERDATGRWLDRRGFKEAKRGLDWLEMVQLGRLTTNGRFSAELATLPPEQHDQDRREQTKIQMQTSGNGAGYVAMRQVDGKEYWFGLAVGSRGERWLYAGQERPTTDVTDSAWSSAELPPDWRRDD